MVGSNNKLNNAMATIMALCSYKHADHFAKMCNERKVVKSDEQEERDDHAAKPEVKVEKKIINNKTVEIEAPAATVADAPAEKTVKKPAKK